MVHLKGKVNYTLGKKDVDVEIVGFVPDRDITYAVVLRPDGTLTEVKLGDLHDVEVVK